MAEYKAWTGLSPDDIHNMLIAMVGFRFGSEPETRLEEIRAERSAYMRKFVALAGVRSDHTVLELGSGCGFGTRELAGCAAHVIACDVSPAYLDFARRELADLDNVELFHVASRELRAVPDDSVDAVLAVSVFIHFNLYDIFLYFKEFYRILRKKGVIAFDFADEGRLAGITGMAALRSQFLEHVAFYTEAPENLPGLVQWNSAGGIRNVARLAGFLPAGRRGNKLRFRKAD